MKKLFIFFLFFIFLISLVSSVDAIRLSPPSYDVIPFESGATHKFDIQVSNNGATPYFVNFSGYGIAESIEFSKNMFQLIPGKWEKLTVKVKLKNYEELSNFGIQRVSFRATQQVDPRYSSGMFAVTTSVISYAQFDVPIPGEYALIKEIDIPNPEKGENTVINLVLENKGVLDLTDTTTKLSITDRDGVLLDTVYFNDVDIMAGQTVNVSSPLMTESYDSGMYFALGELTFSSEKAPSTKDETFFVGGVDVLLVDYTKNLSRNSINKINFELQSIFSQELKNVRGSFLDFNYSDISLPVIDFTPYESFIVNTYIDIPDTNDTTFNSTLTLQIPVPGKGIETKYIPLGFNIIDASPVKKTSNGFFSVRTNVYMVIIIIIFIIIILLFLFSMKKDKKDDKDKDDNKDKQDKNKTFKQKKTDVKSTLSSSKNKNKNKNKSSDKKISGGSNDEKKSKEDFDWSE